MEHYSINNKLIIIAMIFLIVIMSSVITFGISTDTIDTLLHQERSNSNLTTIGATIIKDNKVIYSKMLNNSDKKNGLTHDSPMVIGSLSKSLTALAVMQLVENNTIDLDKPIQDYIPWFEVKDPNISETITVRNLLVQQSGLSRTQSIPTADPELTIQQRVAQLSAMEAVDQPGEKFYYLNDNYNILGALIEEVTDQSYGQYMKQHIFQPLGMDNTTADYKAIKELNIQGHTNIFGFSKKIKQPIFRYDIPSGYIVSTLEDMTTYLNFLITPDEQIISQDGIKKIRKAPTNSNYAMGWHIETIDGQEVISHSGAVAGFSSHMELIPATNSGYVYLINKNHLIYNFVNTFKTLNGNLHKVITDQDNFEFFPSIWVIRFISLVILVFTLMDIIKTKTMMTSKKKQSQWQKEAIKSFVLMLFLSIGLPFILRQPLGVQIDWHVMLTYVPDFSFLLIVAILIQLIRLITSIYRFKTS